MSDIAAAAAEYSGYGWALVKLKGKMPLGNGWQNNLPIDPVSAASIFEQDDCNIGLVLGPSGVIDFELDAGDEDLYWELADGVQTVSYVTGSGKPHLLFRAPQGMTRRTRGGLELRAGSHQSVLPPSIHPDTGEPYKWVNAPHTTPLADPPQALLEYFEEEQPGQTNEAHWRNAVGAGQPLSTGEGRHASLISYLGMAVNHFDTPEQLAAAAIAFAAVTQDPPYPDHIIEGQAWDCWYRYRVEQEDEAELLKTIPASLIAMRSIAFLWRPFLQLSAFHLLAGKKGAGKGSLLAWLASQMTTGFVDDDYPADPMGVLWISTEDSFEIDVKPRFLAQGGDPDRLICVRQRVRLPLDEERLRATCLRNDIGMVIIDPIISVLEKGSDANDEASVISAIGCLNAIADELNLTIIGVRHLGKSLDRGPLESILGSAAWVNTPRAVLGLAQDEDTKVATLEVLIGNRIRGNVSFDFRIEEAEVEGISEPVSRVVPVGLSSASMAEVLKREKGSKVPLIKEWLLQKLAESVEVNKDALVPELRETFGVGKASLDKAVTALKEEELIVFVPGEQDPITGRKLPGAPWLIRLAYVAPEES